MKTMLKLLSIFVLVLLGLGCSQGTVDTTLGADQENLSLRQACAFVNQEVNIYGDGICKYPDNEDGEKAWENNCNQWDPDCSISAECPPEIFEELDYCVDAARAEEPTIEAAIEYCTRWENMNIDYICESENYPFCSMSHDEFEKIYGSSCQDELLAKWSELAFDDCNGKIFDQLLECVEDILDTDSTPIEESVLDEAINTCTTEEETLWYHEAACAHEDPPEWCMLGWEAFHEEAIPLCIADVKDYLE